MDDHTRFGELRSLLQRSPDFELWYQLCALIDRWPRETLEAQALPYALSILSRWPHSLCAQLEPHKLTHELHGLDEIADRVAAAHWVKAASSGKHTPALLLANALDLASASIKGSMLHTLAQAYGLDHIKSVNLEGKAYTAQELTALLDSPLLPNFEALTTRPGNIEIEPELLTALVSDCERFTQLKHLSFIESNIGPESLYAMLEPKRPFERLQGLYLQNCSLTPASITAMATSGAMPALRKLNLTNNDVQDQSLIAIADRFELSHLSLYQANISAPGVIALAQSPRSEHLKYLELTSNRVSDLGFQALMQSPHLHHLERLELSGNPASAEATIALALSPNLSALSVLSLSHLKLTPAHIKQLAQCASPLRALDLSWNFFHDEGLFALLDGPLLPGLQELNLNTCWISDRGAQALAMSPLVQGLRHLDLMGNHLSGQGARALATSPYLHEDIREPWSRYAKLS